MLHRASISMSLLVLAIAGPGLAFAQTGLQPVAYSDGSPAAQAASGSSRIDWDLLNITNAERAELGLATLATSEGLSQVARSHARDMAVRGYVGYADPSGVSLLDQVRLIDRKALIGSFASSIAVLDADASPAEIHAAIQSDAANAANLRREFTHAGTGTYVSAGRLYVVELFSRVDGELEQALPVKLSEATVIRPALAADDMTTIGWSLNAADGELLARGSGRRIQSGNQQPMQGFLNLDVAMGTDVYTLRGPFIEVNN